MPSVKDAFARFWDDVAHSDSWLSSPAPPLPPPPPPPPDGAWEKAADWMGEHPWATAVVGIGIVSAGAAVGYAGYRGSAQARRRRASMAVKADGSGVRRQVVGECTLHVRPGHHRGRRTFMLVYFV